jgi:hypothetical protein
MENTPAALALSVQLHWNNMISFDRTKSPTYFLEPFLFCSVEIAEIFEIFVMVRERQVLITVVGRVDWSPGPRTKWGVFKAGFDDALQDILATQILPFMLLFIAAVVLNVYGAVGGENPPAVRLAPLKPRTRSNFYQQRGVTVIEGLLVARACPAGRSMCCVLPYFWHLVLI